MSDTGGLRVVVSTQGPKILPYSALGQQRALQGGVGGA